MLRSSMFVALGLLVFGTGVMAQPPVTWEIPSHLLVCQSGDMPANVIRVHTEVGEWSPGTRLHLSWNWGVYRECYYNDGYSDGNMTVVGVYDGDGWYRFTFQPWMSNDMNTTTVHLEFQMISGPSYFEYARSTGPDFNASGQVDLTDVGWFQVLFQGSDWRADLNRDGSINVSDVQVFSAHYGDWCTQ